jgi:carbon storage regulator
MLVLARRVGQRIIIGDSTNMDTCIIITMLESPGVQTRVGITAPKEIPIWREELIGTPPKTETDDQECSSL